MSINGSVLIVLGSSLTSLSIIRDACKNKLETILIDTEKGIAFTSKLVAEKYLLCGGEGEGLDLIKRLCSNNNKSYLISTSDQWIKFIIKNRILLDELFDQVLHANNNTLEICLSKDKFSTWCLENNIETPFTYRNEYLNRNNLQREIEQGGKKLFIRPLNSSATFNGNLPKALEIDDAEALNKWYDYFESKRQRFVVTESLLSDELIQYSIPFIRNSCNFYCLTAIKERPEASDCAVGTFVSLIDVPELRILAESIIVKLDYFGMGEIEILYSVTRDCYYVIEINARPWLQYEIVVKAGYSFLMAQIDSKNLKKGIKCNSKARWLNFVDDFYVCFSRSEGYLWKKKISLISYIHSLLTSNAHPVLSFRDPAPIRYSLKNFFRLFKM